MNDLERIQGTDSVADGLMKSDRNFTRIKNELENIDMSEQIGTHDTNDKSHADIRQEIENLTSQTNQMANYLNYMPINGGNFDGNEPSGVIIDGGIY